MNRRDEMEDLKKKKFTPKLSTKGITIEFSRQDLEKALPNLTKELIEPESRSVLSFNQIRNVTINSGLPTEGNEEVYTSIDDSEDKQELINKIKRKKIESRYDKESELYYPKTEDFIRRCSNQSEFEEIIKYQLKIKEITEDKAKELLDLFYLHGIEYFGSHKKNGYYERTYRKGRK